MKRITFLFLLLFSMFLLTSHTFAITLDEIDLYDYDGTSKTVYDTAFDDYVTYQSALITIDSIVNDYVSVDYEYLIYNTEYSNIVQSATGDYGISYSQISIYNSAMTVLSTSNLTIGEPTTINFPQYAKYFRFVVIGEGIDFSSQLSNEQALEFSFILCLDDNLSDSYDEGVLSVDTDSYYEQGQDDMFTNGSEVYGYTESDSFDYGVGFDIGRLQNLNAGLTEFSSDFDEWIVPAIVVVLVLGGFLAFALKKKGD